MAFDCSGITREHTVKNIRQAFQIHSRNFKTSKFEKKGVKTFDLNVITDGTDSTDFNVMRFNCIHLICIYIPSIFQEKKHQQIIGIISYIMVFHCYVISTPHKINQQINST